MLSVAPINPTTPLCCDCVSQALGRCWTWIKEAWHWCVDKVFRAVDAVAFAFFRVVSCFAPNWALKMEAGYGYLATWYARYRASALEEISQNTISDLAKTNQALHKEGVQGAREYAALRERYAEKSFVCNRLEGERNSDIRAREEALSLYSQSEREAHFSDAKAASFAAENERIQAVLQEMIAARAPLLGKNEELADAVENLERERDLLKADKSYVECERDLLNRSLNLMQPQAHWFWGIFIKNESMEV